MGFCFKLLFICFFEHFWLFLASTIVDDVIVVVVVIVVIVVESIKVLLAVYNCVCSGMFTFTVFTST